MRISVILSTYNAPDWLAKSLHGYLAQTDRDFEIVIADDGSGSETASLIRDFASRTDISIFAWIFWSVSSVTSQEGSRAGST